MNKSDLGMIQYDATVRGVSDICNKTEGNFGNSDVLWFSLIWEDGVEGKLKN